MSRRNDGFRVADARQVRIDALEAKLRAMRDERDAARLELKRAHRTSVEIAARCHDLRAQARMAQWRANALQAAMNVASERQRADFDRTPLHRIAWARLRGAVIRALDRRRT